MINQLLTKRLTKNEYRVILLDIFTNRMIFGFQNCQDEIQKPAKSKAFVNQTSQPFSKNGNFGGLTSVLICLGGNALSVRPSLTNSQDVSQSCQLVLC